MIQDYVEVRVKRTEFVIRTDCLSLSNWVTYERSWGEFDNHDPDQLDPFLYVDAESLAIN